MTRRWWPMRNAQTAMIFWLSVVIGIGPALPLAAANWPGWRGPAGDGTSDEQGLPLIWSEQSGTAWKASLPEWGTSTPAVWDDAIFVTAQHEDQLLLLRLDRATGQCLWTEQVGSAETMREAPQRSVQTFHRLHNNASPSPITDGQRVVVHFGNGDLAAYDFDGQRLWKQNLQERYGTYSIWWGHANSPVLFEDLVISVCMQDSLAGVSDKLAPSYLVAHDISTGRERWKSMRMTGADAEQCDSYTTPVLFRTPSRWELIVMGGNQVDAYDPASGRQLWFLPGIVGGRTITGPTVAHDMVFVTQGMRKDVLAVNLGGDGKLSRRDVAWKQTEATPDTCSPVVWGEWLFTLTDNGIVKCYNARTGRQQWKERLPGDYKASPVAAEGRLYVVNTTGLTTVMAADDRFEKLAQNQLDDETIASPAISNGRIYLRGRKTLYAIGRP